MSRIDFVTGAPEKYAHLVDALSTVPERLRDALAGRSADELARAGSEGAWSVQRTLAHMAVYAHANGVFLHRMVTMTDPPRREIDEEAGAAALGQLDAAALLAEVEREIGKTVDFLSETPDAAWGRPGRISGLRRSVRQQVSLHINHMDEHLTQIEAALARR